MVRFDTFGTIDLRASDGRRLDAVLGQRKRLALFAYLLLARPSGFHRRDTLAVLLWPELDARRARAALSRVVYGLRRELGADCIVSRGDEELAADASRVRCDALLLERHAAAGDWQQAVDLYRGDLLAGLFVGEASAAFDHWLDARRSELRAVAADAAWRVAVAAERAGDADHVVRSVQQHLALRAGDEAALRAALALLERTGNTAAAAQIYRDFVRRLVAEFELEPSAETQRAFAALARATQPAAMTTRRALTADEMPAGASAAPQTRPQPAADGVYAMRPARRVPLRAAAVVGLLGVIAAGLAAWSLASTTRTAPTIAVGDIRSDLPGDSVLAFATLLATNLGRIDRLDVVSERRIAQLRGGAGARRSLVDAARAAGADEILEGTLGRRDANGIRLDLRRTDMATGEIVASYSIEARDYYDLVDLAVERLARELGLRAPADRRGASTGSLVAYGLYEEGLRAYYRNELPAARRLFESALAEDSTFAMAAYFAGIALSAAGMDEYLARAVRLAEGTNERERLLISTRWALHMQDPRARVWAESLVVRFPDDLDGRLAYATVLRVQSQRAATIPHSLHVIALDSVNIGVSAHCYACDAISTLAETYALMDSFPQAERIARIWIRREPESSVAWHRLAAVFERAGRYQEQAAAIDSALRRESADGSGLAHTSRLHRTGEFEEIDRVVRAAAASSHPGRRTDGLWSLAISARAQGRLHEALGAAQEFRRFRAREVGDPELELRDGFVEALVLLEAGRAREAAALFDSIAMAYNAALPSRVDAHRVTWWTYEATALAAAGDTVTLARLEERIRQAGARSLIAAQNRRHHYVRGLRLAARGEHADATDSFARALAPYEDDLALIHAAHARSALAAGRHAEAIEQLRVVLSGPVGGAGWSVPRTEFHELLARAFDAAGQADSAALYYGRVLHAWRGADPEFDGRRRAIEGRLARLSPAGRPQPGPPGEGGSGLTP